MTGGTSARALVLGGGGVAGIAWETGLLAGLADAGVDLRDADLIVGTSAGAVVAAQVGSGTPLPDLLARQRDPDAGLEPTLDIDLEELMAEMTAAMESSEDPVAARRAVGELALRRDRVSEADRLEIIEARLPSREWPAQLVKLCAVDAATGELALFDRTSGVSLVDAVAASCAIPVIWPATTIDGRRYYDGGLRSGTNTDAAIGYGRVLVVRPLNNLPEPADVRELPADAELVLIEPDAASLEAIGDNPLDPARRPACANAGYEQGKLAAGEIGPFWTARPAAA
jgi:NTE family protein